MSHVHWSLVALSFLLGMAATIALMVRPIKNEVAEGASVPTTEKIRAVDAHRAHTTPGAVGHAEPAADEFATDMISLAEEAATQHIPVVKDSPTQKLPVAKDAPTRKIPVTKSTATQKIPHVPFAPFGPGSARAAADGGGPAGWLVKGRSDTRLYYTPDDPTYDPIVAQIWFKDEESARHAFFTPWRDSSSR